jgi:hypothetical protein
MKITSIKYEETFPTSIQYKNIRLTADATVDSDKEDLTECYQILRAKVNEAFKEMKFPTGIDLEAMTITAPPYGTPMQAAITNGVKKKEEIKIGVTPEAILSSPDLKTLITYKWLIKGKPDLQKAYDKRMKELDNSPKKKNGKPVLP